MNTTTPKAMSTTVEALELSISQIESVARRECYCGLGDVCEYHITLDHIRAAIPRAELEGQAVELLPRLIDTARTFAMQTYSKTSHELAAVADALLTQIDALKAKDGTPNVNKAGAE